MRLLWTFENLCILQFPTQFMRGHGRISTVFRTRKVQEIDRHIETYGVSGTIYVGIGVPCIC